MTNQRVVLSLCNKVFQGTVVPWGKYYQLFIMWQGIVLHEWEDTFYRCYPRAHAEGAAAGLLPFRGWGSSECYRAKVGGWRVYPCVICRMRAHYELTKVLPY